MANRTRMALLGLLLLAGVGFNTGCEESSVGLAESVTLTGTAVADVEAVKMVDVYGFQDRTVTVEESGRYQFTWIGADLTGFFGERIFHLQVPADATYSLNRTTSEEFYLRADFEAPLLSVWDFQFSASGTDEGGIRYLFEEIVGKGYQPIESYVLAIRYTTILESEGGLTSIWKKRVEIPLNDFEGELSSRQLEELLPGRIYSQVMVSVEAKGLGDTLNLSYHSPEIDINLP